MVPPGDSRARPIRRFREGLLLETDHPEPRTLIIWREQTCREDPDSLGCYGQEGRAPLILVNLNKICKLATILSGLDSDKLTCYIVDLLNLCLIHELTHDTWVSEENHKRWNQFISNRLVLNRTLSEIARDANNA